MPQPPGTPPPPEGAMGPMPPAQGPWAPGPSIRVGPDGRTYRRVRRRRRRRSQRWVAALAIGASVALGVVVVVAVGLGFRYAHLVDDMRLAKAAARDLQADATAVRTDIDAEHVGVLGLDLDRLDSALQPIRDVLTHDPLVGMARGLPVLGTQVVGADAVVGAADDLLAAGRGALAIGDRYLAIGDQPATGADGSRLEALVGLMATSTDEVDQIETLMASAQQRLASMPDGVLDQVRDAADLMEGPLNRYAPLVADYARYAEVVPAMLGWQGRKRYLVLAQDPAELRPTGGFTGTFGVVTFQNGRIVERSFRDVYTLDGQPGLPYVAPPDALRDHLLGDYPWQLADANWSPDFPTSAKDALRLYTLESTDSDIDGVIAVNTFTLDRILAVTGPVHVPEYDVTVAAGETTMTSLAYTRTSQAAGQNRKQFLDDFAAAVIDKVMELPADRWPELLTALGSMGDERLASAWFVDPALQAAIAGTPWSGEVRQDAGDYVFVVDANQAPASKYNLAVTRSLELDVRLDERGDAEDTLRITYQNDAGEQGEPYTSLRAWSTDHDGMYATYTRVLTAPGSEVEEVTGGSVTPLGAPEEVSEVAGRPTFANYLLVPPGRTLLRYQWSVPGAAVSIGGREREYTLTIQKQPGMGPEPLTVRIHLPNSAHPISKPPGMQVADGIAMLTTTLVEDFQVSVRYGH